MKKVLTMILLLTMVVSLFACGSPAAPATSEPVVENTETEAPAQETVSDEPKMAESQVYYEGFLAAGQGQASFVTGTAHRLDSTVNEPMVALTWNGELKPLIAESYEMQEDGKVWILHIREDAIWHDGTPVTADDVIFSYSVYANPRTGSRRYGWASSIKGYQDVYDGKATFLEGVTAIDEKTVRVELNSATPLWMKIEQAYLVIFPYHLLKDVPETELGTCDYWKNRIGTGPFKWEEYKPDQYIMLTRNEDYYLGAPVLEKLVYVIYNDTSAQLNALASGEIGTVAYEGTLITPQDAETYDSMPGIKVVTMDKGAPAYLVLNLNRPEFADKRVRQAMRYAIDVETIVNSIYPGAIPAYTIFPQEWAKAEGMNTYEYNPEKAKELLTEAGWESRKIELIYYQGDTLTQNLIVAIQQYLAAVGIEIEPQYMDSASYNERYSSKEFDMAFAGSGVALDPSSSEKFCVSTGGEAKGYSNARIDELFALGKASANQEERAPYYQEAALILHEELPRVYLWYDIRHLGFNESIVGPSQHFEEQKILYFNMPVYNEIEKWYVTETN